MTAARLALGAMLCLTASAFAAEDNLPPEILLPVQEDRDAYFPCAAFGGNTFLVAWQSGRIAPGDLTRNENLVGVADIVACRIDASGKLLDAKPFVVSGAKDMQEKPRAAFGNGVFLVVWQDLRNEKDYDIFAARVSPEGKVLDPDGIAVAARPRNQALPRVAFDGTNFLVVWQDFRSGKYDVYGARVSPEGKVLDPDGIVLGASKGATAHRVTPDVAAAAGRCCVVWAAQSTSEGGSREPARGVLVKDGRSEKEFEIKGHHYSTPVGTGPVALAAGPKGYLMAWRNWAHVGRATPSRNANAAFLDLEGNREASTETGPPGSFNLNGQTGWHHILDPDVVWDGAGFVAAWHQPRGPQKSWPADVVFATRLSADGKPSGREIHIAGTQLGPACGAALASDGNGMTGIVYEKHPETGDTPIRIGFRPLKTEATGKAAE